MKEISQCSPADLALLAMDAPPEQDKAPDVGSIVSKLRSSLGEQIAREGDRPGDDSIFEGPSAAQLSVAPWYVSLLSDVI